MHFFVKPLSDLVSEARDEVNSFTFWFRKKYNLAPSDPRFLEMSMLEIQKDFLLHHISEHPDFKIEDLDKTSTSDEEWLKSQEFSHTYEILKQVFEGKLKELQQKSGESNKIKPSGLSPLEVARNKVKVSMKSKFDKPIPIPSPLGGDDEEVFRETN